MQYTFGKNFSSPSIQYMNYDQLIFKNAKLTKFCFKAQSSSCLAILTWKHPIIAFVIPPNSSPSPVRFILNKFFFC